MQTHIGEKPYLCRKCEKYFSGIQSVLHKQTQHEHITFKGIKLVNPPGENLCYINTTVNAFLNWQSVMNLVQYNLVFFNKNLCYIFFNLTLNFLFSIFCYKF